MLVALSRRVPCRIAMVVVRSMSGLWDGVVVALLGVDVSKLWACSLADLETHASSIAINVCERTRLFIPVATSIRLSSARTSTHPHGSMRSAGALTV